MSRNYETEEIIITEHEQERLERAEARFQSLVPAQHQLAQSLADAQAQYDQDTALAKQRYDQEATIALQFYNGAQKTTEEQRKATEERHTFLVEEAWSKYVLETDVALTVQKRAMEKAQAIYGLAVAQADSLFR